MDARVFCVGSGTAIDRSPYKGLYQKSEWLIVWKVNFKIEETITCTKIVQIMVFIYFPACCHFFLTRYIQSTQCNYIITLLSYSTNETFFWKVQNSHRTAQQNYAAMRRPVTFPSAPSNSPPSTSITTILQNCNRNTLAHYPKRIEKQIKSANCISSMFLCNKH